MNEELKQTILALIQDKQLPKRCEDLYNPIFIAVVNKDDLIQILAALNRQRNLIQSMADKLGRLAVAIQVGPQAVIDF